MNCRGGLSYNRQEESTDINEVYNGLHEINAKTQSPSHGSGSPANTHPKHYCILFNWHLSSLQNMGTQLITSEGNSG